MMKFNKNNIAFNTASFTDDECSDGGIMLDLNLDSSFTGDQNEKREKEKGEERRGKKEKKKL